MRLLRFVVVLLLFVGCAARSDKGANTPGSEPNDEVIEMMTRLSKPAREHMVKVQAHIEKKEWDEALAELERMKKRKYLDDYERAVMWSTFGVLYYERGDFEQAAAAGDEALKLNALSEKSKLRTQRMLGELYLQMERFDRATQLLGAWLKATPETDVKPEDYYLVASAYAQAHQFAEALPLAKQAVDKVPAPGPKEEWLKLLLALHFELKQDREVLAVLERLAAAFPAKKAYRLQIVETHRALEQDDQALAAMERAYQDKLLDEEKDFTNLAQLYIDREQPLKAAQLLDVKMADGGVTRSADNLRLLGRAWALAGDEERAKSAMQAAEAGTRASQ